MNARALNSGVIVAENWHPVQALVPVDRGDFY